jgi:hypothetical protein
MIKLIRKHKKTIKRQRNLQKQRGKGLSCSRPSENRSPPSENRSPPDEKHSIKMSNLSNENNIADTILKIMNTANERLLIIRKSKNKEFQKKQILIIKNLVQAIMNLKNKIDVNKIDMEKHKTILINLMKIIKQIDDLNTSIGSNA